MGSALLIFRHEFAQVLRRPGFIILTLSVPVLALIGIGIAQLLSGKVTAPGRTEKVGYVDQTGSMGGFSSQGNTLFVLFPNVESANDAVSKREIDKYLVITSDFLSTGLVHLYSTERELFPSDSLSKSTQRLISTNLLSGKVSESVIARVQSPVNFAVTTVTRTGSIADQQGGFENFIIPGIFAVLLALSIIFSSSYLLQGLVDEKENRLMEILLSSISARDLIVGKVFGLGAAGLVQVLVWVVSLPLLLKVGASILGGFLGTVRVSPILLVLGVVYFILGYSLFAVLSSAVAAVSSNAREGQGIASIFTMSAVSPLWFMSLLMMFPNNPAWVVLSIFPFSAPVMVMIRSGLTGVPAWQLAMSMGVLVLSILCGVLLSAKLLRAYVLMYGKRPTLGEIMLSLRS